MELQKYFSIWFDSRNSNPFLFYGVIVITTTLLALIVWLVKLQRQKTKKKKQTVQQTSEAGRPKKYIVNRQELKLDQTNVIQETLEEKKSKTSIAQQSDKVIDAKTAIPANKSIGNTKPIETPKKADKQTETKNEVPAQVIPTLVQKIEIVKTEEEEQSKEKYIGYNPINVFAQTEPLNFPYVIMPKANSVIKFPRKGRVGRKGFKEESFKEFVEKYFKSEFRIFDDRFIMVKSSNKPYEPDFTLTDEKNGVNIFLDIEIDEPYEGLNDITNRKATHFQYADTNRNNAFAIRGWIVIRFAEIQIHQDPNACCRFVADVIKSINPNFNISTTLNSTRQVQPVKQWTKEEAEEWSRQKYREQYLGIINFGVTSEKKIIKGLEETELGEKIEEQVIETPQIISPAVSKEKPTSPKFELIKKAISSNQYLSFSYQGNLTITKPFRVTETELTAFCYVNNLECTFNTCDITNLLLKTNYYTLRITGPAIGIDKISSAVNTAISYKRFIRMKYTRAAWNNYIVNRKTGELILNKVEAEESIRTIMNVQLSKDTESAKDLWFTPNERYITAYCNKRKGERMFRFDRIGEIEILDL